MRQDEICSILVEDVNPVKLTEVNYDITKNPPVPIMDNAIKTIAHAWLPGWITKRWNDDPLWEPGEGYIRRPDVVIVNDPTKPPTQDNIKQVVEIKFDSDSWGVGQEIDYRKIAGEGKLVELTPKKCSCDDPNRKKTSGELRNQEMMAELLHTLGGISGRGGLLAALGNCRSYLRNTLESKGLAAWTNNRKSRGLMS